MGSSLLTNSTSLRNVILLALKKMVSSGLYHTRILKILNYISGYPGLILAYHRVLPCSSPEVDYIQPGMYVTEDSFEKQMRYISKTYNIVSLGMLSKCSSFKNVCVVTFDDGWADNFTYALPILRKYDVPATIFLSTNLLSTQDWTWPDRITYYIHRTSPETFLSILEGGLRCVTAKVLNRITISRNKKLFSERAIALMKGLDQATLKSLLHYIDERHLAEYHTMKKKRPWLTWDEVREMTKQGITFGSHTHNHVILTNVSLSEAREEIRMSKDTIFRMIDNPLNVFSYPNGNFNDEIVKIIKEYGFSMAVTTQRGFIRQSKSIHELKRFVIHNDVTCTVPMFATALTDHVPFF